MRCIGGWTAIFIFFTVVAMHGLEMLWPVNSHAADYPVIEIDDGMYVRYGVHELMSQANNGNIGNSGIIVGSESVAVIDPGGSFVAGGRLRAAIRNVTELPVRYIILTHFHPDHVLGAAVFASTAKILAHKNFARAVAQRREFYTQRIAQLMGDDSPEFLLPDVAVDDVIEIDLGDRRLILRAHQTAHTDNDLTITDPLTATLWAGDLVFQGRTPALDGSLRGWLKVLAELDETEYSRIIPGHGQAGSWSAVVQPQLDYLAELASRVKRNIVQGVGLSALVATSEGETDGNWRLFDMQHQTNLSKAYTELEWE
ncbi:MAG: quinoprotein relay system zinc metallohydrolase 2 [Granulosicoccus sp.]